jgi:hypothetical protein
MLSCERLKGFFSSQITGIKDDEREKFPRRLSSEELRRLNQEERKRREKLKDEYRKLMTLSPENRHRRMNY